MAPKSTKLISKKQDSFFGKKKAMPFFSTPLIQPKLTVNQPNDMYEQEADAVADKVMRMEDKNTPSSFFPLLQPISNIQRNCETREEEEQPHKEEEPVQIKADKSFDIHRKCVACEHEEEMIHRHEDDKEEIVQTKV